MTTQVNTAVLAKNSGAKGSATEAVSSSNTPSIISSFQPLDNKTALYLGAHTINLGNQSRTHVAAVFYRPPVIREVSSVLLRNPRQDATQHALSILNHYAQNFPGVEKIYFSLDGLGFILAADNGIPTEKLSLQQNPIEPLLKEKIAQVMADLRTGKGI